MRKRKYLLPIFLLLQIMLLQIIGLFPEWVERFYSNGVYPVLGKCFRFGLGWIGFSIGDMLYFVAGFLILRWIWKKRKSWKLLWKDNILDILSVVSIAYFLFHVLWAFNYYRVPLFEKMQLNREYTDEQLIRFTEKMIANSNAVHRQITQNDSLKVVVPYSVNEIFEKTQTGYSNLSQSFPFFDFENLSTKKSLISIPLSYMGFGGYLNPFTNEAQVNRMLPMYHIAMTTSHEMAHQIGYASESEANFIGFLAVIKSDDLYLQYSGYVYATRYCLSIWAEKDFEYFELLKSELNYGILENYRESEAFSIEYESVIEDFFKLFYNNFLKINQQQDGLAGYSKFINLLISFYETNDF